jgi:hypothetical protein
MTTPAEPRVLSEVGGIVVAEHGPLVVVVDRGTGRWATLVVVLGVLAIVSRLRRRRATSLSAYRSVAVFDRARRVFTDGDRVVIAPLDHARLQRKAQLTSSSPMLVAVTPAGTRIIKRGTPFDGGLGDLDAVLTAAVFGTPR